MTGMEFGFGSTVTRQRRKTVADPYSGQPTAGDWTDPDEVTIDGAFVASTSSSASSDPIRSQVTNSKSLYGDPNALVDAPKVTVAEVEVGDRIVVAGHIYRVDAVPAGDINPFSGWQPVVEIPLIEVLG